MSLRIRGTIYCILSGILFGLMGWPAVRLYALNFSVENVLFWRFTIATLCMGLVEYFLRKRNPSSPVKFNSLLWTITSASLIYTLSTYAYFTAATYIGTGIGMVLFFFFPVFIAFYLWLRGKWEINFQGVAALVAVLLGLVLLYGHGNEVLDSTGVILSLTAGLLYACYILMNRKRTQIASSTLTFYTCLGTAVLFFCLLLSNHTLILPHSSAAWFYILFLGIISTVLPIQLLLNSLQYISSTKVSVLSIFEPVVMVIVGVIFLNEKITFMQGIGILVMLAGAILIQFEKVSEGN